MTGWRTVSETEQPVKGAVMKIVCLSFLTGKKLSRSFSEKETVVGEEALRNESKVVKRRLGLW